MHFSIPEVSEIKDVNQGNFKVYHIHANGILHCKLRFKQLNSLHEQLKKKFGIYSLLPFFPPKKLFPLKEIEIEERRALLEKYMQLISQDEKILNSSLFNDFLLKAQQDTLKAVRESVKLDVLLADNSRIQCQVISTDNSMATKEAICRELKLPIKYTPYFSLFIAKEQSYNHQSNRDFIDSKGSNSNKSNRKPILSKRNDKFINGASSQCSSNPFMLIRKMMDFESPYLSLRTACQTSLNTYHLKLIKFYWDIELDQRLIENDVALSLIYLQAISDFERQSSEMNKDHYQCLQSLALRQSKKEYILFAKCVKNYGSMFFEQCICNFPRSNTNCSISIKSDELILNTLIKDSNNRTINKVFILRITRIRCWRLTTGLDLRHTGNSTDDKRLSFNSKPLFNKDVNDFNYELSIEYLISKDELRWIVIKSEQAVLMSTCLKSAIEELVLKKNNLLL